MLSKNLKLRYVSSFKCDGHCPFCHREGLTSEEKTRLDRISRLAELFSERGFKEVTLAGGEPFPWDNLFKVMDIFNKNRFNLQLTMCGIGLSQDVLSRLPRFVRSIHLSVPSFDPNRYYHYTGIEFANFKRLLEKSLELGISIRLNYTITREEAAYWRNGLQFAIEKQVDICLQDMVWCYRLRDVYGQLFVDILDLVENTRGLYWELQQGYTPRLATFVEGIKVEVKSARLNRIQRYSVCDHCEFDEMCSERICSLRIYPGGTLRLCLGGTKDLCWAEGTENPEGAINRLLSIIER